MDRCHLHTTVRCSTTQYNLDGAPYIQAASVEVTTPKSYQAKNSSPNGWQCPHAGHGTYTSWRASEKTVDHSPMSARSLCRTLRDSTSATSIPSLVLSANLRYLAREAEVQVIDIDDKKEGPQNWPLGTPLLRAQSEGTPIHHWWYPLPPSCQPVFYQAESFRCPGHKPFSWAFCKELYQRPCGSLKRIHRWPSKGHTHSLNTYSKMSRRFVTQELPWWKLYWLVFMRVFVSRKLTTFSLRIHSKTFPQDFRRLGWWVRSSPCLWDPFWGQT